MRTFNYPSELSIAFSGHRLVPRVLRKQVKNLLVKEIENAYNMGYRYFLCGMAMGFDLMAAEAALSLKSKLKELKLIAVIPHPDQTKLWDEKDKDPGTHHQFRTVLYERHNDTGSSELHFRIGR